MMRSIKRIIVLIFIAIVVVGCSTPTPTSVPLPPQVSGAPQKVVVPDAAKLLGGSQKIGGNTLWLVSTPNPPARGNNSFEATLADADGNAINDARVAFDLNMTNMNMGRNNVLASFQGAGRYSGALFFSMGGPWRVIVLVQRPGQPDANVQINFSINR